MLFYTISELGNVIQDSAAICDLAHILFCGRRYPDIAKPNGGIQLPPCRLGPQGYFGLLRSITKPLYSEYQVEASTLSQFSSFLNKILQPNGISIINATRHRDWQNKLLAPPAMCRGGKVRPHHMKARGGRRCFYLAWRSSRDWQCGGVAIYPFPNGQPCEPKAAGHGGLPRGKDA